MEVLFYRFFCSVYLDLKVSIVQIRTTYDAITSTIIDKIALLAENHPINTIYQSSPILQMIHVYLSL